HTRSTRDWSSDVCSSDLAWAKTLKTRTVLLARDDAHFDFPKAIFSRSCEISYRVLTSFDIFLNNMPMFQRGRARRLCLGSNDFRSEERRVGMEGRRSGDV